MPAILHRDRPARPGSPPLAARAGSTARHHLQSCGLTPTSTEAQGASRAVSHTLAVPGTRSARKPRADHTRFCSELSQELVAALEFQTTAAARVGCAGLGQRVYVGRAGSGDAGHRCERVCAGVRSLRRLRPSAGHRRPGLVEPKLTLCCVLPACHFFSTLRLKPATALRWVCCEVHLRPEMRMFKTCFRGCWLWQSCEPQL